MASELVFIPEGEKDVDALRQIGLIATCNSGGAGKWRKEYNQWLSGKNVVVLPDNDRQGREHSETYGNPTISWMHRDALGLQEDGKAYDPFGSLIYNVQPPSSGPPPSMPFYGPGYSGASWSTFTNANNFSSGCMLDGAPANCSSVLGSHSVNIEHVNYPGAPDGALVTAGHQTWVPGQDSGTVNLAGTQDSSVTIYGGEGHFESDGSEQQVETFLNLLPLIPQNSQPLPSDLKDRVSNVVNNPKTDCADFIKKLIGNLKGKAFSDNPMKLFERVQQEKGFRLGNTGKYAGLSGMPDGKRQVTIRPVDSTADARLSEHQAYAYAVTALNELMHQAKNSGLYLDRELAVAIFPLLSGELQAAHPLPKTNDVDTNSAYFHSLFNLHCRSITGE